MIFVVDTSSFQRFLAGFFGSDTSAVRKAIARHQAYLPPVVVTEALSNRFLDDNTVAFILRMPVLPLLEGYWRRAGEMRANRLSRNFKAKPADTLIAQCCLDYDVPLITYDGDFENFVDLGLKLV